MKTQIAPQPVSRHRAQLLRVGPALPRIDNRLGDPYSIVTEMNDDSNREVAQVIKADDFIASTQVISLLLTQLTENQTSCWGPRPVSPRHRGGAQARRDRHRLVGLGQVHSPVECPFDRLFR
ncbi:hypothetical protein [Streptomyces alanosinicus]|uniref:hypothetical protein n=1 Tax=Streptomyces alanosinicus TaxID=68171 RepID=UPI001E402ABC|nr:hypothetical protein [Streptomyces alanosinicus]